MKIKNMKLMLLGLLAMGSMNAFAVTDEAARSVNGVVYELVTNADKSKTATVLGINSSATDAQMATIAIPAEVAGEYGTYKVTAITAGWEKAAGYKDVTAKAKSLSIDVTNLTDALADNAFSNFTKLESLTITDSNAADKAKTKEFKGGFSADAKKTLKTVDFSGSNISIIGDQAFQECIALTGFNFAKVTKIGVDAFKGCYGFTELTIPNTVKEIGSNAFANMYLEKTATAPAKGLQTLTFNANDAITEIPDAFEEDALLKSVTITSAKATTIAAGAFTAASELETLDLSGCTALTSIDGAFAASTKFVDVKLAGTKLASLDELTLTESNLTLKSITFPAAITTIPSFQDFVALESVDLSNTKVTEIPDNAFQITGNVKDKGKAIDPKLASVTLNGKTTKIGAYAFDGQTALATVANLNQGELTTIGEAAFNKVKFADVDLSAAAKLKKIPALAFANMATLTSIKLNKAIEEIETGAFAYDKNVASFNLGELEKVTTLNPIFHEGVVGVDADAKEVAIALTSLTLPSKLKVIAPGALQLLDIEEIEIPATVYEMGDCALQGCINLKEFTWNTENYVYVDEYDHYNWFKGDDKLEEVYFLNTNVYLWLNDNFFFGNDKNRLTVYVTTEAYNVLIADQNWNENSVYSTLAGISETEFDMTADGKNVKSSDGYYYRTLVAGTPEYNGDGDMINYYYGSSTWINESEAEVFSAVIEGANVVLKPVEVENGYYKVRTSQAVVIRSTEETVAIEQKNLDANRVKTTVKENELWPAYADTPASRLKFQYKLGVKDGQVKFWRVTSGTIKMGVPYLWTENIYLADREFLDMIVEGEATAIKGVQTKTENDGAIYNLQGVRVKTAQKGLYIQNGKKFIVK